MWWLCWLKSTSQLYQWPLVVRLHKLITKFTTAILRQCTNVWLFFQKIGPPYHNTSVYRCMEFFYGKMGPMYHITSVYQRMATFWKRWVYSTILRCIAMAVFWKKIFPQYYSTLYGYFWKKWVQRTIIRECTNEWLFNASVPTYGYFLEKNLSTVLRSTTLRRCTGVRLFWKSYYTEKEEKWLDVV
jgi:hypothetical protein